MTKDPAGDQSERDGAVEAASRTMLADLGRRAEPVLPLAEAALAFATLDRPVADLGKYRRHLGLIEQDLAKAAAGVEDLAGRVAALSQVLVGIHGYTGDTVTYDDLANASLIRVIDRRRGLPVALGILYIHAARAQGWIMHGLAFPGHFLVRLETAGQQAILDPFAGGVLCDEVRLHSLLKAMGGPDAALAPEHFQPATDREVLLRLQNNIKTRLIQKGAHEEALGVLEAMQLLAPDEPELWRQAGMLNAELGRISRAITCLETALVHMEPSHAHQQTVMLLQQVRRRLH